MVLGQYLWSFLTPPVAGADLRAAIVANCFLGALPPADLRAVRLVRAMLAGADLPKEDQDLNPSLTIGDTNHARPRPRLRYHTRKGQKG